MFSIFRNSIPLVVLVSPKLASAACAAGVLCNPLQFNTITQFLQALIEILLIFAVPLVIFFIIYAGFKYVTANGNPAELSKANKALLYAIIGGVIIFGATIIGQVIQATVDEFTT